MKRRSQLLAPLPSGIGTNYTNWVIKKWTSNNDRTRGKYDYLLNVYLDQLYEVGKLSRSVLVEFGHNTGAISCSPPTG